jgi:hypothetical protein
LARLVHASFAESALHFFDATRAQDEVFAEAMSHLLPPASTGRVERSVTCM